MISLLLALLLFAITDGIGGVPWTDLVAKSIPSTRRGRLLGTMQSVGGIGAFFAGLFIRHLLATVAFPRNYALLLSVGFVFMVISLMGTLLVKEKEGVARPGSTMAEYWRRLPRIWRESPLFQRMMFTRMLFSCFYLSLPFYVIFAQEKLGFAESTVGLFLSALMAGSILASMIWGYLGDKHGNRTVIRAVTIVAAATPILALLASFMVQTGWFFGALCLCFLVFATVGATLSGNWMGFTNYLLDVVSDIDRPSYVGMMNTLTAPFTFLPIVGGLLLRYFVPEVLFACTFLLVLGGVVLGAKLPEPRALAGQRMDEESVF
ncbi:MAG: MFS transporter [Firmicutes bacterium]|nr:MFS transporter [Bacillota bacterium]